MSKSLSKSEINDLKNQFSITDVARALGIEIIQGKAKCWQLSNHSNGDKTPSLSFNDERGIYKCWVCNDLKGDTIDLIQRVRNCNFLEALEWLKPGVLENTNAHNSNTPKASSLNKVSSIQTSVPLDVNVLKPLNSNKPRPEIPLKSTSDLTNPKLSVDRHREILTAFLAQCSVPNEQAFRYLKSRRIFMPVVKKHSVKWVHDYNFLNDWLKANYTIAELQEVGLCNERGHLRFFRHPLLLPYLDRKGRVAYIQARAIEEGIQPRFLNLKGEVPFPWNLSVLNGEPDVVFLCESVLDALTLEEKGFCAVGVAGTQSFKKEWIKAFKFKKVYLAFDADKAGQEATQKLIGWFKEADIYVSSIQLPDGMDVNDWFSS